MKVLTIGHSYVVGANRAVMRELHKLGADVTVAAPAFFHGSLRSLTMEKENTQLTVVGLPVHGSRSIHLFFYDPKKLAQLLDQEKWDFVYLWEEPYIVSGWQVARELRKRKIPFAVFSAQNINKKYFWPFGYFEKKVLEWAQGVLPCGELVSRTLSDKGLKFRAARTLPLAVDTEFFKPFNIEEKNTAKKKLGLKGFVIGYLGRLTEEKGLHIVMKMLEQLPKDHPWSALIMGSGPLEKELRQWITDRGLTEQVQICFLKHDEVASVLPVCDVLLAPSQTRSFWREQFGRMIVEAFAAGVPVIASRSGEIPFVVGDAGLLADEDRLDDWMKQLRALWGDENHRQELVARGLKRVQEFSAVHLAQAHEKAYKDLLYN